MKKKNLLFVAAAMVMAGCASDDMIGDNGATQSDNQVIGFNMSTPAMTRATDTGVTAAGKLDNEFIVWGEKNENTDGSAASAENLVFKNYRVDYTDGTKNTTLSNTENWEYVGITPYAAVDNGVWVSPSLLNDNTNTTQTIKYWDFNASSYTFTAVSALKKDITDHTVKITKITEAKTGNKAFDKGYTIEVGTGATTGNIYVADRKVITKPATTPTTIDRTADNTYGGNATLTFRSFQSKVRFGIYETVPGYKVVITGIKYNTGTSTSKTEVTHNTTSTDKSFGIDGDFVVAGSGTKYTVTYESTTGANQNRANVAVDQNSARDISLNTRGTTWLSTTSDNPVSDDVTKPTYDFTDYTPILPNPSNETNLTLKIAYKLVSEDTGEEIKFKDANDAEVYRTVEVPADYCKWKSNFAYTYLFKITDKSADLYPITFDAVVETDEFSGTPEIITTVTEPSITTFAVKSGKYVSGENEYEAGDAIYATVVEGSTVVTLVKDTNIKLYKVKTSDAVNYPITEASVAQALDATYTVAQGKTKNITTEAVTLADENIKTTVPGEDGKNFNLKSGSALTWTADDETVYAVEYINGDNKTYKIVHINGAKTTK